MEDEIEVMGQLLEQIHDSLMAGNSVAAYAHVNAAIQQNNDIRDLFAEEYKDR